MVVVTTGLASRWKANQLFYGLPNPQDDTLVSVAIPAKRLPSYIKGETRRPTVVEDRCM